MGSNLAHYIFKNSCFVTTIYIEFQQHPLYTRVNTVLTAVFLTLWNQLIFNIQYFNYIIWYGEVGVFSYLFTLLRIVIWNAHTARTICLHDRTHNSVITDFWLCPLIKNNSKTRNNILVSVLTSSADIKLFYDISRKPFNTSSTEWICLLFQKLYLESSAAKTKWAAARNGTSVPRTTVGIMTKFNTLLFSHYGRRYCRVGGSTIWLYLSVF